MNEALFEAANRHVIEQGRYCNQLINTINDQGRTIRTLMDAQARIQQERDEARAALAECQRVQAAMRQAVYGAAEGL